MPGSQLGLQYLVISGHNLAKGFVSALMQYVHSMGKLYHDRVKRSLAVEIRTKPKPIMPDKKWRESAGELTKPAAAYDENLGWNYDRRGSHDKENSRDYNYHTSVLFLEQ